MFVTPQGQPLTSYPNTQPFYSRPLTPPPPLAHYFVHSVFHTTIAAKPNPSNHDNSCDQIMQVCSILHAAFNKKANKTTKQWRAFERPNPNPGTYGFSNP